MPQYKIENPTGGWMLIEGDRPPTQDEAAQLWQQHSKVAIDNQYARQRIATDKERLPVAGLGEQVRQAIIPDPAMAVLSKVASANPSQLFAPPQNYAEGLAQGVNKQINLGNAALAAGAVFAPEYNLIKALVRGGFAGQGAALTGQSLGQRLNDPTMTPAQKGESDVNTVLGATMVDPRLVTAPAKAVVNHYVELGKDLLSKDRLGPNDVNWSAKAQPGGGVAFVKTKGGKPVTPLNPWQSDKYVKTVPAPDFKATSQKADVHGGAQEALPPAQRAQSEANNSKAAWAGTGFTIPPTRTIMDAAFADVRHKFLPFLTKDQQLATVEHYVKTGQIHPDVQRWYTEALQKQHPKGKNVSQGNVVTQQQKAGGGQGGKGSQGAVQGAQGKVKGEVSDNAGGGVGQARGGNQSGVEGLQGVRPAVRTMDGTVHVGEKGSHHNDIIAAKGLKATDIDRRLFVDAQGNELSREQLAALGVPGEPTSVPGAHSTGLAKVQSLEQRVNDLKIKAEKSIAQIKNYGGWRGAKEYIAKQRTMIDGSTMSPQEKQALHGMLESLNVDLYSKYPHFAKIEEQGGEGAQHPVGEKPVYPLSTSVHEGKLVDKQGRTVDPGTHLTTGESGFNILPTAVLEGLFKGSNKSTKVDPLQMLNRLRNVLGEDSDQWKMLQGMGVGQFVSQPRSTEELKKWAQENGPKVEMRKFGAGTDTPKQKEYKALQHWRDTLTSMQRRKLDEVLDPIFGEESEQRQNSAFKQAGIDPEKARRYNVLVRDEEAKSQANASHWGGIVAPKSEKDMPGYVEIAVVKPAINTRESRYQATIAGKTGREVEGEQFPSSHNFPPNTLGFVRGYMETVNGEKVFHVIEVQSDWAHIKHDDPSDPYITHDGREFKTREEAQAYLVKQEPLLAHNQRLALKAAIEHARAEGATRIAVSDAETAMMTEMHDRGLERDYDRDPDTQWPAHKDILESRTDLGEGSVKDFINEIAKKYDLHFSSNGVARKGDYEYHVGYFNSESSGLPDGGYQLQRIKLNDQPRPPQEPGMRLHYDQTLPKILGELTGNKGERVEFGEHKGAYNPSDMFRNEPNYDPTKAGARKDLIFRNPDGTPKTSVTARAYEIGKKNPTPDFSLVGKDKGEAGSVIHPAEIVGEVWDKIKNGADTLKTAITDDSTMSKVNFLRGKDLPTTLAASKDVADKLYHYAQSSAVADVLSKHEPTEVLGNVDDKKLGKVLVEYNLRATGNTSIGKPWGWKDDAEYQAALADPDVQAAIQRHADIVLGPAEERHTALGGSKVTLDDPRMFVNLKFVPKAETLGVPRGNIKALLQRKSKFGQERKGTAEEYETSYRALAERMIKANYSEANRLKLNQAYVDSGLGQWVKPGDAIPQDSAEIPVRVQRAIIIPEGEGSPTVMNQNKSLYIRKDLLPEYMQAMQANSPMASGTLRKIGDFLTKLQVSLGVDAIQHTANMVSAVNGAVRTDLGRNIVGVKEADTIARVTKNLFTRLHETPEYRQMVIEMAKRYGIAREEATYKGLFGGKSVGGSWIRAVDEAGRVTLFELAKELQKEGLIKDDPAEIRRFVNTQLGQYNKRLMNPVTAFAKATFSPFVVAGKTFNRLGATRLLMSPQIKAANPQAWAEMRARQALYVASALVLVPAVVNYAVTGNVLPPDAKLGEIELGNGKKFDMAKWTLIRRGLRVTGAEAVLNQQVMPRLRGEQPAAVGQTAKQAFTDVARGVAAPYAGPFPNSVASLLSGKTALGYEGRQPGETFPYVGAAARQLNPLLGAGMTDQPAAVSYGKRAMQLAGVSETKEGTLVNNWRRQFLYKQGKAKDASFPPSDYDALRAALLRGDKDTAKKAYDELYKARLAEHKNDKDPVRETQMDFQKYFERFAKARGNTKIEDEKEFVKTLTPHQKDVYDKAVQQQEAASELFFSTIQPRLPKKGKGFGGFGGWR